MDITLYRTYYTTGTNGALFINGALICYTIELPWLNNKPKQSCIPEGRYELVHRWSPKFEHHLLVTGVPHRSLILLHPANDAVKELKGCIAPVLVLTAPGRGNSSRRALTKLLKAIKHYPCEEPIFITIKKQTQ